MCLALTAGAPGQSQAPPSSQNTQQNQQDQNTDDAEPAEFHPPAEIGQPAAPSPAVESHPSPAPAPPLEPRPPAPVESAAPASPPVKQPEPPLSSDPEERQLQIDTSHLLQLTEELKTELDKAGSNTLSLTAVRKADEVLKLAKALKERMKDRGQVIQSKP
jgi:outer membrane biosynthesis protein TonB